MPNINPFADAPHHSRILATHARREALARLTEGLGAREPFVLVTGEAGTGKTTLVDQALGAWGPRAEIAQLVAPGRSDKGILESIVRDFRIEPPAGADQAQLVACLGRSLADRAADGQIGVLVIDQAHLLASEHFEAVQHLPDALAKAGVRIEVVLVGLPTLEARLFEARLAPLARRIGTHCRASSFSQMETRRHLHESVDAAGGNGRAVFPRQTCREIFKQTRGIPREVNALAAEAWHLANKSKSRVVTPGHVRAAKRAMATTTQPTGGTAEAEAITEAEATTEVESITEAETVTKAESITEIELITEARATSELKGDARVSEWVSRFIGPDEPRFGAMLSSAASESGVEGSDPVAVRFASEAEPTLPDVTILRSRPTPARGSRSHRRRSPVSWTTPAAVALVAITAVVLLVVKPRGGRDLSPAGKPERTVMQVDPEQEQASGRSTQLPAAKAQASASKQPASQPPVSKTPHSTPRPAPEGKEESAPPTPSRETNPIAQTNERYTLEIATGLSSREAEREADRLASESGLQAWVVTDPGAEWSGHRVVLGIYSTAERARNSVAILIERGMVSEARVIALPPRHLRH